MKRPTEPNFGKALRAVRRRRGLSQEAFDQVSSRTHVSSLERGVKQPTLSKVSELASVMNVHPVTLVVLSFSGGSAGDARKLLLKVSDELVALEARHDA
jgi:transcriptional regulator with XRE-family HTH domain